MFGGKKKSPCSSAGSTQGWGLVLTARVSTPRSTLTPTWPRAGMQSWSCSELGILF